jgi:hypothetical protein
MKWLESFCSASLRELKGESKEVMAVKRVL